MQRRFENYPWVGHQRSTANEVRAQRERIRRVGHGDPMTGRATVGRVSKRCPDVGDCLR